MPSLRRPSPIALIPSGVALAALPAVLALACAPGSASEPPKDRSGPSATASALLPAQGAAALDAGLLVQADAGGDAAIDGALEGVPEADDPGARHFETREELLALFTIKRPPKRDSNADGFLAKSFGYGKPSLINQGNKELAQHLVSKAKCLKGLEGITLQTDEQKATCGGLANMVPIHKKGRKAKACIDVFEFPNQPCELPMVWTAPVQAKVICELQGKRLCSQEEWILACRGDPEDGKDRKFAYGDELDLEICNTHKSGAKYSPNCDPDSASSAWKTCATNTEPAGAFPACRSRFGVFDQHGNVAEIMTRLDPDGHTYSQLKGSAFFYTDVARKPDERQVKGRETYPDHCAHDPRWHVEPMREAWHVNYHLGFRCCKTVK